MVHEYPPPKKKKKKSENDLSMKTIKNSGFKKMFSFTRFCHPYKVYKQIKTNLKNSNTKGTKIEIDIYLFIYLFIFFFFVSFSHQI